jgi:hypothetical protein
LIFDLQGSWQGFEVGLFGHHSKPKGGELTTFVGKNRYNDKTTFRRKHEIQVSANDT